jgi:hypothetical protein
MKPLALLVLLPLFAPVEAYSAELTPFLQEGRLGAVVTETRMPRTLRKDLMSGLTNRILIRVALLQDSQPLFRKVIDVAVKYDLWEETFSMETLVDETAVASQKYRQVEEVIAALANLRVTGLFAVGQIARGKDVILAAEVLFDPIDKERMEEIRKWVAENSRPAAPGMSAFGAGVPAPDSDSRALFNKIFEQYAAGAPIAAAFRDTAASRPFRLEELRDEPGR